MSERKQNLWKRRNKGGPRHRATRDQVREQRRLEAEALRVPEQLAIAGPVTTALAAEPATDTGEIWEAEVIEDDSAEPSFNEVIAGGSLFGDGPGEVTYEATTVSAPETELETKTVDNPGETVFEEEEDEDFSVVEGLVESIVEDPAPETPGVAATREADRVIEVHVMHHQQQAAQEQQAQAVAPAPQYDQYEPDDTMLDASPTPRRQPAPAAPTPAPQDTQYVPGDSLFDPDPAATRAKATPPPQKQPVVVQIPDEPVLAPATKGPMFVWRGKPFGTPKSSTTQSDDQPAEPATKVRASRVVATNESIGNTWFHNTMDKCIADGASDLHLVMTGDGMSLDARVRIDGTLRDFDTLHGDDARAVLGRFKSAAGLASGGSFVPESTIYEHEVEGEMRKSRVQMFRTSDNGGALVLRLPPSGDLRRLDQLQFSDSNLALFRNLLGASSQMVVVAGPMGSGKTTTAHGALAEVSSGERSVWSVEDPVERRLPGVVQLEVDEANGAGFDALLPALVRADYDTLFLGEIRDKATAAAGIRQAKAGRQVITTIHGNNNVVSLLRLIELAEDSPLSVLSSVLGVVSQRLVRKVNPAWDGEDPFTRYKGRVPIHEALVLQDDLIEAFMDNKSLPEINRLATAASEGTFHDDAQRLIDLGLTDADEVRRVLGNA